MAFTGTYNGNTLSYITQSGTDANLSGLAPFTYYDSSAISTALGFSIGWTGQAIYFIDVPLIIEGSLTWDSSSETLVSSTSFPDATSGFDYAIKITGNGASVSIGVQQGTNPINGLPRYSSGLGLITGFDFTSTQPLDYIYNESVLIDSSATLTVNGSEIQIASPLKIASTSGIVTFNGTRIVDLNNQQFSKQTIRNESSSSNLRLNDVEFDSKYQAQRFINLSGIDTFSGKFLNSFIQPHRTDANVPSVGGKVTLKNVSFSSNFNSFDWQAVGNSTTASNNQAVELTNVDIGTKVRPNMAISGSDSLGHIAIFQNVKVIVEDTSFNPIENCNIRIPTTNSGNRNNTSIGGQFIGNLDFTGTTYSEYTDQTISTGESQQFKVLTGRIWNDVLSNTTFTYDLYGKSQVAGEDKFDIQFRSYFHNYATQESVFNGDFDLVFKRVLTTDTNITETNNTNVDNYTDLGTAQKIYDAFKSEWLDLTLDDLILDRTGNQINLDLAATSLVIDATAGNVRDLTGTVATVKAFSYSGGAFTNSSGTVTTRNGALLNGGTFDCDVNYESGANTTLTNVTVNQTIDFNTSGTYTIDGGSLNEVTNSSGGNITLALLNGATVTTNTGANITLTQNVNITAPNILDGTRVQFFNITKNSEISITVVSGGNGYTATVDLLSSIIDNGDDIALKCSFYDTTSGNVYDDLEIFGNVTQSGLTSSLSQSLNTIISSIHSKGTAYHGNNVTGFSLDVANIEIDSNIININGQKLATWFAHEIATTNDGIRNYFNSIQSIDERNFRFKNPIKVDNTGLPATWTSAAWVRTDGLPILAPTSNSVQFNNALSSVPSVGSKDSEIDAIKAKTDLFTFTGNDVKATLDGEQVVASNMRGTDSANTVVPNNSGITQIQTDISNLNDITASDVYTEFTTGSNEDAFKADVSFLATEANATANTNSIISEVNANEDKINLIETKLQADERQALLISEHTQTQSDISSITGINESQFHNYLNTYANKNDWKAVVSNLATQVSIDNLNDLSTSDIDARLSNYGLPTLTEITAAFTEIKGTGWTVSDTLKAIKDELNNVGTSPSEIYNYFISGSNEDAFKADVSSLATQSDVTTAKDEIIADNRLFQESDEYKTPTGVTLTEKGNAGNVLVEKTYTSNGQGTESLTEPL